MNKMDWDSKFWEVEIYNIDEHTNFDISRLKYVKTENFMVQALINEDNVETINILEENGFRFIETKINLIKKHIKQINLDGDKLREVNLKDIEDYENSFGDLYYKSSRYSLFGTKKVNAFYYKWISNTIEGKMDDKCFGYFLKNKLAGFITYKIRNKHLYIGLVGVFEQFQKQGIVQILLDYVNNIAVNEMCQSMHVSTQGKNYIAINSYVKNGYFIESIQNWYYLRRE